MKYRWIRLLWLVALFGPALVLALPEDAEPPIVQEQAKVRLVRLPVLLDEKTPGACSSLSESNIDVQEDGRTVGTVYLEPGRLESIHAILIDASFSMLGNLGVTRKTMAAHVAALPGNEPVLLATLDDSLLLHVPLSTDRERFNESLGWIEVGDGRHLWDGVRETVRYLAGVRGRKVLLLITDGCDTQRVASVPPARVIEEAGKSELLLVFAIGIALPASCPGSDVAPAQSLRDLVRATGGEFHALDTIDNLEATMAGIRQRLERERVVQYEPPVFGAGPKDQPAKLDHRYRKISLGVRKTPGCRLQLAGPAERYEKGPDQAGSRPFLRDGPSFKEVDGGRLEALLHDVIKDGGAVLDPTLLMRTSDSDRPRLTAERKVVALVPPLAEVVRTDASPQSVVFDALEAVARPPLGNGPPKIDGDWTEWADVPFLVNGRTLLHARPGLARTLADHAEYGRWAAGRVRDARLAEMDTVIRNAATPERKRDLEAARASLAAEAWEPEPEELQAYLGAWLGDVRAPVMFNAAETWLARRLLIAGKGGRLDRLDAGAAEAERLWKGVSHWFPPAEDVRAVGLLVPGYDPERELIGYYRVILRQSAAFAINSTIVAFDPTKFLDTVASEESDRSLYFRLMRLNYSRNAPLGARMIRWMIEQELVRPMMDKKTVASIRYTTSTNRDLYPLLSQLGLISPREGSRSYPARQVTLVMSDRDNPDQTFEVSGYFPTLVDDSDAYAEEPGCIVLPDRMPTEGAQFELFGALYAAKKYSAFPCVFQAGADSQAGPRPSGG